MANNKLILDKMDNDYKKFVYQHSKNIKKDLLGKIQEIFDKYDLSVSAVSGSTHNNVFIEFKSNEEISDELRKKIDLDVEKVLGQVGWKDLEI